MTELDEMIARIQKEHPPCKRQEEPKYECEECQDTGWIHYEDEAGYFTSKKCKCWAMREARRLMEQSGISAEFQNKSFENYETKGNAQLINAKKKAISYYERFSVIEHTRRNSIMFCGQVGSGKTHLGTAICSNLMNGGVPVAYMAYRNIITKLKQKMLDAAGYEAGINQYSQAKVLYIDDFLKGKITEADINIMYEIINYRYMNNLPIIVSTEKSLDQLLDFDEAIGSRMIEMCRGNIVEIHGRELNYRLN